MQFQEERKTIRFVNKSPHADPNYASAHDSGMDIRAWVSDDSKCVVLKPLERRMIHTGIYVELPYGTEIQVRPKSGRAIKEGLSIINAIGTVDNFYRGEVCVLCVNLSNSDITIKDGEKIAQMVLMPVYHESMVTLEKIDEVSKDTERGDGGFGHNGLE